MKSSEMTEIRTVITESTTPIGLPVVPAFGFEVVAESVVTAVKFWRKLGSLLDANRKTLYEVAWVSPVKFAEIDETPG